MDNDRMAMLDRFEREIDAALPMIVESVASSDGFAPVRDSALPDEVARLARQHIGTFIEAERQHRSVKPGELDFLRERAAQRAREMIPLAAAVNAHLTATRSSIEAIARAAGDKPDLQAEAFKLAGRLVDYSAVAVPVLVEAYIETVEGERADREAERRTLLEELLTRGGESDGELGRRARSLGLEPRRDQVVVCGRTAEAGSNDPHGSIHRWAADTIARATGRGASRAFIVVRPNDFVAVLDSAGSCAAHVVLTDLIAAAIARYDAKFYAGIGIPFSDLGDFRESYDESQRALRHASGCRPIVTSPGDITLFEELVMSSAGGSDRLIPAGVRQALQDVSLRATLYAYLIADLNVANAAKALSLHPNSLRYRLRAVTKSTGLDPRRARDLFELCAAARIIEVDERSG
jgi:sugar diacid utilization regulator